MTIDRDLHGELLGPRASHLETLLGDMKQRVRVNFPSKSKDASSRDINKVRIEGSRKDVEKIKNLLTKRIEILVRT